MLVFITCIAIEAAEDPRVLNLKELPEGFANSYARASGDKVIINCFKESPYLLTFSDLTPKRIKQKEAGRVLPWVTVKYGNDLLGQGQILSLGGKKSASEKNDSGTPRVVLFLQMGSEEQAKAVEKQLSASRKPPLRPLPEPTEK